MSWFKREDHEIHPTPEHEVRTEGLWVKCDNCRKLIWKADLEANLQVCPHCGFHFRIGARERLNQLLDEEDEEDRERWAGEFRDIVGSIVVLETPLSTTSLARLLGISKDDEIGRAHV